MATLTIIPYAPKPPKHNIRKLPSKLVARQPSPLDENLRIDPSDVLLTVGGAAVNNNWCQKAGGDSEDTVQEVQACGDNLVGARAALIAEKEDSDNDTDNEFPSLARLSSLKYNHISVEEKLGVQSTTKKSDDRTLNNSLLGSHRSRAPGSYDEPITLNSDDKPDNDDSNLYTEHTSCTLNSGRLSNNDSDIGIDNTEPLPPAKRQRSASSSCNSILRYAGTSPLSYNEDWNGGGENIDNSDHTESDDDDVYFKWQRLSDAAGGRNVLDRRNQRPQRSPLPILEQDEDDGILSNFASTSRSPPIPESAPLTEPQLRLQVIDADQDWEVRQIIGKEDVDGVLYYMVDWHPTLMPEHSLGNAKELVDKFEARLRAQRRVKNRRRGLCLKRGGKAVGKADIPTSQEEKPRGRARKQM